MNVCRKGQHCSRRGQPSLSSTHFVCLSPRKFTCLSPSLSVSQSFCLPVCLPVSQSVSPKSVCLSACLPVCLSLCLSICLSSSQSVCLTPSLSVSLSVSVMYILEPVSVDHQCFGSTAVVTGVSAQTEQVTPKGYQPTERFQTFYLFSSKSSPV